MFQSLIKKESSIIIFMGFIFYFFIENSEDDSFIDVYFVIYYFSLFSIFGIFIKNIMRNFFISLPLIIIVIYINLIVFFEYDYDWWIPEFEVTYLILMLIPIFILLAYVFKEKNIRKFFISLTTIIITVFINFYGLLDYQWWWNEILMTHLVFMGMSAFALLLYIFKGKYLWWLIFSPLLPMAIMYILEKFYPCLKPVGLGAA